MTTLRALFLAVLACVMTLTGIAAAEARGRMGADGVICGTGTYAVIIAGDGLPLFDADGAPVELSPVPCLDCVFVHAGPIPDSASVGDVMATGTALVVRASSVPSGRQWIMGGKGRGPPVAA